MSQSDFSVKQTGHMLFRKIHPLCEFFLRHISVFKLFFYGFTRRNSNVSLTIFKHLSLLSYINGNLL